MLIYSLLFLKYTQRPLALGTGSASSPSPKYTPVRLSETWAKPAGMRGPPGQTQQPRRETQGPTHPQAVAQS